jgi:hypothetical protein
MKYILPYKLKICCIAEELVKRCRVEPKVEKLSMYNYDDWSTLL